MSGASMKQIKTRIKSVESTRQITRAMELVATSKLRRAKQRVENARPFHEVLLEAVNALQTEETVYFEQRQGGKHCYVVIAGDRGLAGGYNANLFRMMQTLTEGEQWCVLPVGKKALEHFQRTGAEIVTPCYGTTGTLGVGDCAQMARLLCGGFAAHTYDRVTIVYTEFRSMLSQVPTTATLLPLARGDGANRYAGALVEGDPKTLVEHIVPQYAAGILYAALCEAAASEHGARRTAMNSANKNAGEIIDDLVLHYNRARQAAITQEITEIVSGAEAL